MTVDVIDTFKITTPPVNQEFVRKLKMRQVYVRRSHTRKSRSCLFRLNHISAQCLGSLHIKQHQKEQLPAKKRPSDRSEQMTNLSDDAKNASLRKDRKKLIIGRFQCIFFHSVRMYKEE